MKAHLSALLLAWLLAGCQQANVASPANLIGTHDLVLVDDLAAPSQLAGSSTDGDGVTTVAGIPARFLVVTSADTNELRMLENVVPGLTGRRFVRAPNPLQALSIPVLDRPTLLAADEGRNAAGARVTGAYVYAGRPGAAEVSVVSLAQRRQLGGRPMPTPAPVTAMGAYMNVDPGAPVLDTPLPPQSQLYVATWDGSFAAVYRSTLATASPPVDQLTWERLLLVDQTPITALRVVAPLASRTLDGAPFCATGPCLAIATRLDSGKGGQSLLLDPASGRSARLSFSGPVRYLTASTVAARLYGILDEQACGSAACGGVVAVDLATGTSAGGFPTATDALGQPMRPLREGLGLITGLTVAAGGRVRQTTEVAGGSDGGATSVQYLYQEYNELGAFASSTGFITYFTGLGGSVIDFDGRRSTITAAGLTEPGLLPDGGRAFLADDGGALGTFTAASVSVDNDLSKTWRNVDVTTADGGVWSVDISDGYLETQAVVLVNRGQLPGLVSLPTREADGVRLAVPGGAESRAAVGDPVRFETGSDATGYATCGQSEVATIGPGFLEVSAVPAGCAERVRFSVRAAGARPLVAVADLEGYLGRWGPGETLTYSRTHVLLPAGVTAPRTALSIAIPQALPAGEGGFISFQVEGRMTPFRASIDTTSIGCYTQIAAQTVAGNLVLAPVPVSTAAQTNITYGWTLFGVVPSGNGVVELNQSLTRAGALGLTDGANCWR